MPNKNDRSETLAGIDPSDFEPDASVPHPDDLLSVLADPTRRRATWYLLNQERTTVEELADVLLGWQVSDGGVAGPSERSRMVLELHHIHLPKLDACDLVDFDPVTGEIRRTSVVSPVRDLIRRAYRYDRGVGASEG